MHQESQEQREVRFQLLSELITDCCWARWVSPDGTAERLWVNEAFFKLTGYSPEEFEAVGRDGLVHPEDLPRVRNQIDGPIGESTHEFRIIRKDGEVRWLFERMLVRQLPSGGLEVLGATRDVTAEREAERVLRESHRELEAKVVERTRELESLAADLRRSVDMAESANQAKTQFLASVSHELRTPLHGIVATVELLLKEPLPEKAREWGRALHSSVHALRRLVSDVHSTFPRSKPVSWSSSRSRSDRRSLRVICGAPSHPAPPCNACSCV